MDTRIMTDPEALILLRDELIKLSKAIQEIETFLKENIDILGQSWQDPKYIEFRDAFANAQSKCKSISVNYRNWAQNVMQPAINRAIDIQKHRTAPESDEKRYLRWVQSESQRLESAEYRAKTGRGLSYPFMNDGSQEGKYVPPSNIERNIERGLREAVETAQKEMAEEAQQELMAKLQQKNIDEINRLTKEVNYMNGQLRNWKEQLHNLKDVVERQALLNKIHQAEARRYELLNQLNSQNSLNN